MDKTTSWQTGGARANLRRAGSGRRGGNLRFLSNQNPKATWRQRLTL